LRLRIGIGHPGRASQVTSFVLSKPSRSEQGWVEEAIDKSIAAMPLIMQGELERAMHQLHST
jgi:PTH1 family peptidyl-tRNA hydrolase